MTERQRTVAAKVTRIKLLHIVLMIVWPVVTAGLFFLTIHMREQMGIMTVFALLMVFMWGSYSYYILLGMRNDHLRSLAVDLCDFSAYLECMQFVQRFYINGRAALGQRVYLVDAYLMKGDFDSAYRLLKPIYHRRILPCRSVLSQPLYYPYYAHNLVLGQENPFYALRSPLAVPSLSKPYLCTHHHPCSPVAASSPLRLSTNWRLCIFATSPFTAFNTVS